MSGIKAIETRYKGYRFRSRLEARWAVFFDALGIAWEYEKQGFALTSGNYLPDFWLPKHRYWIEIKGEHPSEEEQALGMELAEATDDRVFLFFGSIFVPSYERPGASAPEAYCLSGWDCYYNWCECSECGSLGIQFDGRSDRLPCKQPSCCYYAIENNRPCEEHGTKYEKGCRRSSHGDKGYALDTERLCAAYGKALSARFEFGESGAA
jgi:hypothetical protein